MTNWFCHNTRLLLEHFAARNVRGTFFVLGLAAEKAPELVREIAAAGHEIQSHGYGHRLIHTMTAAQFREDVRRAKRVVEDLTGSPVVGYRAPAFSITQDTLWALDVLCDCGFEYDASIFPVKMRRYGIDGAIRRPHRVRTLSGATILELPVASASLLGRTLPVGGGGYFRLFPYVVLRRAIRQINNSGHSGFVYMHPYEYNPDELRQLPVNMPLALRLHQSTGRRGFRRKVDRLLADFSFAPIRDVLASLSDIPLHHYRRASGAEWARPEVDRFSPAGSTS